MSTEAATVEAPESFDYSVAGLWAGAQHEAGFYLGVPAWALVHAYMRKLTRGTPIEETLSAIEEHERWRAAEKRRRDEETERVRVAFETEPAAPEVAPCDEEVDATDREHAQARDAFLAARSAGDETDVMVLRVRAHETYRASKRAKYKQAATRGVYTSVVTEWARRDGLDRHADRLRELMLACLLSDEIALRYDEAPTFSAVVWAYRDAATKLRAELELGRACALDAFQDHQADEVTRAASGAQRHEHRGATRAVRPCTVRVRGSRRTSNALAPPGDDEGCTEPPLRIGRVAEATRDRRNRAGREWCAGLTGELHLGGSQLHQAAHDARLTQQDFTTPHGAPLRGSYRVGLTRQIGADAKMRLAPGGNRRPMTQAAEQAGSGPDTRILRKFWPAGKGELHALCAGRARAQ